MSTEKKRQLAADIIVTVAALILLVFAGRLWPVLLLMILVLFAYAMWKLFRVEKTPTVIQAPPPQTAFVQPGTEQELVTAAFGLLTRRITQRVLADYPQARWIFGESDARERFARGEPLTILLGGASGHLKALVQVSNLQMFDLTYLTTGQPAKTAPEPEVPEEPDDAEPMDYGLLAFEWAEANFQRLNAMANEAAARSETEFRIPAEELPHGDSWPAVCTELIRNGFASATPLADGIHVKITNEE